MTAPAPRALDRLVAWWTAPARSLHVYAVAAFLGLAMYLLAYGPGHMFGTSPYWDLPQNDTRAYLMAYRYWLHEPWHWPLFDSNTMNVPYAKSIAFSDAIPAWALINKSIATVIPPWGAFTERAYLGLWYVIVFTLQACTGVAILRQLGQRSWGAGILTALFFLAVPAWIFRYVHASMTAHFLLLWALYLYVRAPAKLAAPRTLYITALVQLVVAALVNPYHVVMSLGVFTAMLLRSRNLRTILIWFPLGAFVVGIAAWVAGYFSSGSEISMPGFTTASTNMLSMFVPLESVPSGILGGGAWIADVNPTKDQYEGWAYLGLGFIAMFALFLPHARQLGGVIRRHPVLFAVALGAWLFALSSHIYFGSHRLVAYDFPSVLRWFPEHYRAPGRFVWLPMYVLLVFLLAWSFARFRSGWKLLILPALCVVQLLDARGVWSWPMQQFTGKPLASLLDIAGWRPLVHAHDAVSINPPYDCVLDGTPNIDTVSLEIQWLASERTLPINGVYTARPTRSCDLEARDRPLLVPRGNVLYVFLPQVARVGERFRALGAACGDFAYGRACSNNHAAIAAAIKAGTLKAPGAEPTAPKLAYGQRIELGDGGDPRYVLDGWSYAETGGRWTEGEIANLVFELAASPPPELALKIQTTAVLCGKRKEQDLELTINGTVIGTLHFDKSSPEANSDEVVRSLPIPAALRDKLGSTQALMVLRPRDVRSPKKVRCNSDTRHLGVWVRRLWFE